MSLKLFCDEYHKQLHIAYTKSPDKFFWAAGTTVHMVVDRMQQALIQGNYSNDGVAFRATCKALNIKPTYKAVEEFLK